MKEPKGVSSKRVAGDDGDVGARSASAVMGLLLVLPAALLLCLLAWKSLQSAIWGAGPPSYVGEPQSSASFYWGMFGVAGVIGAFLCNVAGKIVYGLVTGRSVRALIPWWFAWGMLGLLGVGSLLGAVVVAVQGDMRSFRKLLIGGGLFIALLLGPARGLRARQSGVPEPHT